MKKKVFKNDNRSKPCFCVTFLRFVHIRFEMLFILFIVQSVSFTVECLFSVTAAGEKKTFKFLPFNHGYIRPKKDTSK